jgi:putative transposase
MVQVKGLTELTLKDLWKEVKEEEGDWWGDFKGQTLRVVKRLLEGAMREEILEQLRVERYRRDKLRRGYRNGYRYRSLLTEFGFLDEIRVPRDREGTYQPAVSERYQRREQRVNRLVWEMFLLGVSTRKVQEVLTPLLEEPISAQTVSRISKSLDAEVRRFHERSLEDNYRYLFLDGITLKVKGTLGVKKRLALCAYGITLNGKRELVSFRQATAESELTGKRAFLRGFVKRIDVIGRQGMIHYLLPINGMLEERIGVLPIVQYRPCF